MFKGSLVVYWRNLCKEYTISYQEISAGRNLMEVAKGCKGGEVAITPSPRKNKIKSRATLCRPLLTKFSTSTHISLYYYYLIKTSHSAQYTSCDLAVFYIFCKRFRFLLFKSQLLVSKHKLFCIYMLYMPYIYSRSKIQDSLFVTCMVIHTYICFY